jgi:Mg-chelatase subunit ChlD
MEFKYFPIETVAGQRQVLIITTPKLDQRSSVHFTILLDTSGSMDEENKLLNVKKSLNHLLKYLADNDQISIIEFSSRANVILNRIPLTTTNRYMIQHKINQLNAGGGTNLSASLAESLNTLYLSTGSSSPTMPEKQGILLLTDGYINEGIINENDLTRMVFQLLNEHAQGTSLTCVGYGTNHNAELLRILAAEGGAAYDVVQDLEDVARVFANTLGALISCSAQQVEVIFPGENTLKEFKTAYAIHNVLSTNTVGEPVWESKLLLGDLVSQTKTVLVFPPGLPQPHLKGCEIHPLRQFNEVCIPTDPSNISQEEYALAHVTYYRQEVAQTVENVRKVIVNRQQSLNEIKETLLNLAEEMKIAETTRPHNLYSVLQEEITETVAAIDQLNESNELSPSQSIQVAQETSQVLAQHSVFLSMGRGVRAHFTQTTPILRELSRTASTTNPTIQSVFSNSTQRNISQNIVEEFMNVQNSLPLIRIPENTTMPLAPPPPIRIPENTTMPLAPPPPIVRGNRQGGLQLWQEIDEENINHHRIPLTP